MSVGRAADRDGRGCRVGEVVGGDADWRAWLGGRSERLRVGKAERVAKTFRGADVPGEQGHVLQVVGGSACVSDEGLRRGKVVLGVRVRGFEKEVGGSDVRAAAAGGSPGRDGGRSQPGRVFPGPGTLRPWNRGSWRGSLMNSASCWVSGCTSLSSTMVGAA